MTALLTVRDLAVHFPLRSRGFFGGPAGSVRAVDGVGFELGRGEALGLVGESGSGKSTIARAIVGLERPTGGSIVFDGRELADLTPRARREFSRRIQMVFQDPFGSLDPRQTVGAIVAEPLIVHGLSKPRERRIRVEALLTDVGLRPEHAARYPHEFSGGQRQRIAIARALAPDPELVVCDEPTSALDVSIQAQIIELLADLGRRRGLAYLFISHDLAVVRHVCARVAVMYLGRIVEIAPRDELFARPRHPYTSALLRSLPGLEPGAARPERLGGEIPSPLAPPSGCAFHPRCPERGRVPEDRCATVRPELEPVPEAAACRVACHLERPMKVRRAASIHGS